MRSREKHNLPCRMNFCFVAVPVNLFAFPGGSSEVSNALEQCCQKCDLGGRVRGCTSRNTNKQL